MLAAICSAAQFTQARRNPSHTLGHTLLRFRLGPRTFPQPSPLRLWSGLRYGWLFSTGWAAVVADRAGRIVACRRPPNGAQ